MSTEGPDFRERAKAISLTIQEVARTDGVSVGFKSADAPTLAVQKLRSDPFGEFRKPLLARSEPWLRETLVWQTGAFQMLAFNIELAFNASGHLKFWNGCSTPLEKLSVRGQVLFFSNPIWISFKLLSHYERFSSLLETPDDLAKSG